MLGAAAFITAIPTFFVWLFGAPLWFVIAFFVIAFLIIASAA